MYINRGTYADGSCNVYRADRGGYSGYTGRLTEKYPCVTAVFSYKTTGL